MSLAELKKVAEAKLESIRGLVDEKEYLRLLDLQWLKSLMILELTTREKYLSLDEDEQEFNGAGIA